MARRPHQAARRSERNSSPKEIPKGLKLLGILLLVGATGASVVLALDHFALATPPGCGPQSGCDQAARSAWGAIPILNWPTSLLGVAYFFGLLIAWIASSHGIASGVRACAWLGAIGSALFITVMVRNGYICNYCVVAHVANFLFVGIMELSVRASRNGEKTVSRAPVRAGFIAFIIATIGLAIVHAQTGARRLARSEADRQATTEQIAARSAGASVDSSDRASDGQDNASTSTTTTTTDHPTIPSRPFTGRWRLGPANAPIRIVMFTDYQCPDCRIMESQAMALLQRRSDVSLSVKHFPICADCNPHVGGSRMHPNACWAARAAETAGILKGNDGFWQMHRWLFERRGSFTDADFPPELQRMGFDVQRFLSVMQSGETLRTVIGDIDEGFELGLHFTPMIFINGVELRGFIGNPGALTRTVDELAKRNLPPGDASNDQPVRAIDKYLEDWSLQPFVSIPNDASPHIRGNADATLRFVLWGDLQDKFTADAHRAIVQQIDAGRDIAYEFRHFPADQACNPRVARTVYPMGCVAARAAEAAASIGGESAYWKMHDWLIANQGTLNDAAIVQAAAAVDLDASALLTAMNSPAVSQTVAADVSMAAPYTINNAVPTLYFNGRRVPRWKIGNDTIILQLIDSITK